MPASVPSAIEAGQRGARRVAHRDAPWYRPDRAQGRPAEHVHRHDEARDRPAARGRRAAQRRDGERHREGERAERRDRDACGPAAAQQRADDGRGQLGSRDARRGADQPGDDGRDRGAGMPAPRDRDADRHHEGGDARHPGDADQEHRGHQRAGAQREARELERVERAVDAVEQQRHDQPAEHQRGAADDHHRLRHRGGERRGEEHHPERQHGQRRGERAAHDHRDQLERVALQGVGEHPEAEPQEESNHAGPSPWRRPPTRSRNRVSRSPDPRTSSMEPAASTRPRGDDRDVVAHPLHQFHRVAGHDHRAAGLDEAVQDVADVRRRHRIDRLERLVEHEQARRVDEGCRERDLLGHAGGVVRDEASGVVLEIQQLQQIAHAAGEGRAIESRTGARRR